MSESVDLLRNAVFSLRQLAVATGIEPIANDLDFSTNLDGLKMMINYLTLLAAPFGEAPVQFDVPNDVLAAVTIISRQLALICATVS